jgi:hypothetical protein
MALLVGMGPLLSSSLVAKLGSAAGVGRHRCTADAFFSNEDPVLFDVENHDCCNWGTDKLASWRKDLRGSHRFLRDDCHKIECVNCHRHLVPLPLRLSGPVSTALLQFAYNGSLPIVDDLSGDGYRNMFRHLLLAAKRYNVRRLLAICECVLCRRCRHRGSRQLHWRWPIVTASKSSRRRASSLHRSQ